MERLFFIIWVERLFVVILTSMVSGFHPIIVSHSGKKENMKKLIGILIVFVLMVSCEPQGTLKESYSTHNKPMVIGKDTVDLYLYWPDKFSAIWVAKVRNQPVISLTYSEGKTHETVVMIDNCKGNNLNRIIKGYILSENDSIVVVKKK